MTQTQDYKFLDSIFGASPECMEYSDLIFEYAEQKEHGCGMITDNTMKNIEAHIENCISCYSLYEESIKDLRHVPTMRDLLSTRKAIFYADMGRFPTTREVMLLSKEIFFEKMGININKITHAADEFISKTAEKISEIPSLVMLEFGNQLSPAFASVRAVNKDSFKGESRGYYEVTRNGTKDERTFKLRASYNARGQVLIIWRNPDGSCRLFSPLKYEEGEKSFTHWDGNVFIFSGVVSTDEQLGEHLIFISILPENTLEPVDNKLSDEIHTLKAKEILENLPEDSEDTIIYLNLIE